jgi:glycosyltransferase involved in cell wall biosynthesis
MSVAVNSRVLFTASNCYLDNSNGAAVASRAMMEALARHGFSAEALSGTELESRVAVDSAAWLAALGLQVERGEHSAPPSGAGSEQPDYYRLERGGVSVTLDRRMIPPSPATPDPLKQTEPIRTFEAVLDRLQPHVLVNYGGDWVASEIRRIARDRGIAIAFVLHNFAYESDLPFHTADAVLVPSRFAAAHYRNALGLQCTVLPNLVDFERSLVPRRDSRYLTFVNPSYEKGVYVFSKIADELGRLRPDIPLLVVEGRGCERTLADCGLDLRVHGNVSLMANTPDPRHFWSVTRLCLMPSLWWENQPLVAVEAMLNGIPVIGADRGGIPECLGGAGVALPLPERLTPFTRELPTSDEVAPWIDTIIRLWDDGDWYAEQSRRALAAARRWAPDVLEPRYVQFFRDLKPAEKPPASPCTKPAVHNMTAHVRHGSPAEYENAARPSIESGIAAIKRRCPRTYNDCDDDPVFLLASSWRSGSTVLQRMIGRSCFIWSEPFGQARMIDSLADQLRSFTDRWPDAHLANSGEDGGTLNKSSSADLYPSTSDLLRAHQCFFNRLFAEPARRSGAERWGLSEVRLDCDVAFYLKWLFPRAKFLFLIRNPYDTWRSLAALAAKGWKSYYRWPDIPVTVRGFAAQWRRLTSSFVQNHHRVDGLVVRYEDLFQGEYADVADYLGFPLSNEAARLTPGDDGPLPLSELLTADRISLEEELGSFASSLGYEIHSDRAHPVKSGKLDDPGSVIAVTTQSNLMRTDQSPIGRIQLGSAGPPECTANPGQCIILVPVGHRVEPACEDALRALEARGYTVRRVYGYSAIDQARNQIATDALRDGYEELFWIDSDIAFEPSAVEQLRSHGLPMTCGIYPKKGIKERSFACIFPRGIEQIGFGHAGGLVEVTYTGAGFLHTRREVYQTIQDRFHLRACNERFGPSMIPLFQPLVVPDGQGLWYLAEDYSFCHRARECGYRIVADTTIRLQHIGVYAYCWEDAGSERLRHESYSFRILD